MSRVDGTPWKGVRGAPLDRFFRHVVQADSGCWNWTGAVTDGYGRFQAGDQRVVIAHRWPYEQLVAEIPAGLQLDHLCLNTTCVNVFEHLDPVPPRVNVQRAPAHHGSKTHCPQGHPYDEANTRAYRGRRHCLTCRRSRVPHPDRHGTTSNYTYGCRCEPCRAAVRAYDAKRRERVSA